MNGVWKFDLQVHTFAGPSVITTISESSNYHRCTGRDHPYPKYLWRGPGVVLVLIVHGICNFYDRRGQDPHTYGSLLYFFPLP